MLNLSGQIATLNQNGKQVAGLYDWDSRAILNYTTKDGVKEYSPVKFIDAQSYWILEEIRDNQFDAEFYSIEFGKLILMDAGKVIIDFPDLSTLDQRLYAPISVRWVSSNDH